MIRDPETLQILLDSIRQFVNEALIPRENEVAETDAMQVVHHAAYIVWFEAARVAWMAELGIPYQDFAAGGHHFAVTGLTASYRRNCRFGDAVQVRISLNQVRTRQISFDYEVVANGALVATATTDHICVDLEGNAARIPDFALDVLSQVKAQAR